MREQITDPDGELERRYFRSCSAPDIADAKAEMERRESALAAAVAAEIDRRIPIPEDEAPEEEFGALGEDTGTPCPPDVYPPCRHRHTAPRAQAGDTCEATITPYNAKTGHPCGWSTDLVRVGGRSLCSAHAWCRSCQRRIVADEPTPASGGAP